MTMRDSRDAFRLPGLLTAGVIALSIALHSVAAVLIWIDFRETSVVGVQWSGDAIGLVCVSLVLSGVAHLLKGDAWGIRIASLFRTVNVVLIGFPMGNQVGATVALAMSLSLDVSLHCATAEVAAMVTLFTVGVFSLYRGPILAWGYELPPPALGHKLVLLCLPWGSTFLGSALRWSFRRLVLYRKNVEALNDAISRLTEANRKFQDYAVSVETESAARERNRVVREIHDTLGYSIATAMITMEAASAASVISAEKTKEILRGGRKHLAESRSEIHRTLLELRSMPDPTAQGLSNIAKLLRSFEHVTSLKVRVEYGNMPLSMGSRVDMILYRFVEESITNSLIHGHASELQVSFLCSDQNIIAKVSDNGVGAKDVQQGIGLLGMQERLAVVRGTLYWASKKSGFEIRMEIPITDNEHEDEVAIG